ncbi:MAG TPA: hypothetical protein VMU11_04390 [Verrucomicrobiae bacterium]|nr:hypothetical protein [Verrucomicrobiae bacterium]
MQSVFRKNRERAAIVAPLAALVSFLASVWAIVYALSSLLTASPVQAAEALSTVSSTLSVPAFSNNWLSDPTKTNVQYSWSQAKAFQATSGDACETANDCFEFDIHLPATGVTTTQQGWATSTVAGDIQWNAGTDVPANTTVDSIVLTDNNGDGINDELLIKVDCSATCVFATSTQYTFSIVNYPLINPEQPGGYTGTYTSLAHSFQANDLSVGNQPDESKTAIVAVGKPITVSASVTPTLTFTVSGVAGSTPFYGDTSDVATTDDTCDFGALTPGTPKVCLFGLEINTNATNGYSIYVVQDQDMTFNGNTIKKFKDGTRVDDAAATFWTPPLAASYGHLGYSSTDVSVFSATGTAKWAGIPDIATSAQAPVTTGLVANSAAPGDDTYTYALKIESASTLPQGTNYTHKEYFLVVGNF